MESKRQFSHRSVSRTSTLTTPPRRSLMNMTYVRLQSVAPMNYTDLSKAHEGIAARSFVLGLEI
jgi:hypothetical protein